LNPPLYLEGHTLLPSFLRHDTADNPWPKEQSPKIFPRAIAVLLPPFADVAGRVGQFDHALKPHGPVKSENVGFPACLRNPRGDEFWH